MSLNRKFCFSADLITQARIWLQRLQRLRGLNAELVAAQGSWPSTSPMSASQVFLLATRYGGLALRREDLGIIAPGAKADLVVFDTSSPAFLGWIDPVAAVILHAGIDDIEHVLVDGKFVKRNGKLTHSNYSDIRQALSHSAARIQTIWEMMQQPNFSGMKYANETSYAMTTEIDTLRRIENGYGSLALEI